MRKSIVSIAKIKAKHILFIFGASQNKIYQMRDKQLRHGIMPSKQENLLPGHQSNKKN